MIFDFYPWKLEVDIDKTKELYIKNNYAIDKKTNEEFVNQLSDKQMDFFLSLGVNPMKIEIDKKVYDIPDEKDLTGGRIQRIAVNFIFCGKFLVIPEFQKDLYEDDKLFGNNIPSSLKVISLPEDEYLVTYNIDNIGCGIVFKHPCSFNGKEFTTWDCGYVKGSILIMTDL